MLMIMMNMMMTTMMMMKCYLVVLDKEANAVDNDMKKMMMTTIL